MDSNTYLWPIFVSFTGLVTGLVVTPLVIGLARKNGFLSAVDFRRKQSEKIPLLGGLGIFLAVGLGSVIIGEGDLIKLFVCSVPVFMLGVLDDKFELSSKAKAMVHVFSVFLWLYWMPESSLWMLGLGLPNIIVMGFMAFWVVGLINALNMIDGMDTEAGGVSLVATLSLLVIFWGSSSSLVLLPLAGALIGFLWFNKAPAKIYLGDSGSNFLGFYLGAISLCLPVTQSLSLGFILVPLFIFAVPEIDVLMAVVRRFKSDSSIFGADHDHIHHKLQKVGFNKVHSAAVIHGVSIYAGLTAYLNYKLLGNPNMFLMNFLAISGMSFVLLSIYFLEYRQAKQVSLGSRSLIAKHLILKQATDVSADKFSAVVYDLLPYYKELQLRGIIEVNEFVESFSKFVKEYHRGSEFVQFGSYTIISVHKSKYSTKVRKKELIEAYYAFLEKFEVIKSRSLIPWGMSFYSSSSKGEVFIKKFGLSMGVEPVVELKKTA